MESYAKKRRENVPLQRFILFVILVCCLVKIWRTEQVADDLWLNMFCSFLYWNPLIYKSLTSILFVFNTIFLTMFLRRLILVRRFNYYSSFIYMLLCFVFPESMTFWGVLIGAIFMGVLFPILFDLDETNGKERVFIYGTLCGLLTLLYAPLLLLLVFLYFILIWDKLRVVRFFVLPVFGIIFVYVYLFSFFYLFDRLDIGYDFCTRIWLQFSQAYESLFMFRDGLKSYLYPLGATVFLGVISFFWLWYRSGYDIISRRKKNYLLLLFLLIQFWFTFFFHRPCYLLGQVLLIFFSMILCLSVTYMRNRLFYVVVFGILFVISFWLNFF